MSLWARLAYYAGPIIPLWVTKPLQKWAWENDHRRVLHLLRVAGHIGGAAVAPLSKTPSDQGRGDTE